MIELVFRVLSVGLRLGVIAFALLFPASACLADAGTKTPPLEFSWFECKSPANTVFNMNVSRDGRVAYSGQAAAKVLEKRDWSVERRNADAMFGAAMRLVRAQASIHHRRGQPSENTGSLYCLQVRLSDRGRVARVNLAEPGARRFNQLAERYTGFRKLVCPGRLGRLSTANECGPALIQFAFLSPPSCPQIHWILIYPTGDVLHTFSREDAQDQYFEMSPDDAVRLAHLALGFEPLGDAAMEQLDGTPRIIRGTASQQANFSQQLAISTARDWGVLSAGPAECPQAPTSYQPYLGLYVDEAALEFASKKPESATKAKVK